MAAKDGAVIVDEFPVPNPSTSRGWKTPYNSHSNSFRPLVGRGLKQQKNHHENLNAGR